MSFPQYTITTLLDFCKVPFDRREDCLSEFRVWISTADFMVSFMEDMGTPIGAGDVQFVWMDDGKHDIHIGLHGPRLDPGYLAIPILPLL
jgi:hypothetical protein